MPIVWRNEMSVGNAELDNDHKYLISLINVIEAAVNSRFRDKVLLPHISELFIYTEEHFAREEKIQGDIRYPETHKQKHKDLIKQLQGIRGTFEANTKGEYYNTAVQELFDVLKTWLVDHILNEDMKMKPYFK